MRTQFRLTVEPVPYAQSEQELESALYTRGTDVSFAEFIAYRDLRDCDQVAVKEVEKDLDETRDRVAELEEELENLKTRGWDVYLQLSEIDANEYTTKAQRSNLNGLLLNLAGELEEVVK